MALGQPARPPRVYAVVGCTPACGLSVERLGPENARTVHKWFEARVATNRIITRASAELGIKLTNGAVGRHLSGHLRVEEELTAVEPGEKPEGGKSASDLEVLEGIITAGWKNSGNWRPSIQDTLKAMDMKYKLTQGSVFDEFFDAISGAQMDDEEAGDSAPENPAALDDLPEPFSGDS